MTFIDQIKYLRINQVTLTQKEKEKSTLCMVTLRHHLQTPLLLSHTHIIPQHKSVITSSSVKILMICLRD